ARTTWRRRFRLDCFTKLERLRHVQTYEREAWTTSEISRNDRLSGFGRRIESAERRDHDTGFVEIGGKCRSLAEDRIAVGIASGGDVERRTGTREHERADAEAMRSRI